MGGGGGISRKGKIGRKGVNRLNKHIGFEATGGVRDRVGVIFAKQILVKIKIGRKVIKNYGVYVKM